MTEPMDEIDVKRLLDRECANAGSVAAWARENGVSKSYVSGVLNSEREIGPKILDALGLRRVTRYVARPARRSAEDRPHA